MHPEVLASDGWNDDQELVDLALEPLTAEEDSVCPDCVLDAIALASDIVDVACNGLTFGRGVAVLTDAISLVIPGLPSASGARIARKALFDRTRTYGLEAHKLFAQRHRANGWITERHLPKKALKAGEEPVSLRPDAIFINSESRTITIRELKPNSASGERAAQSQLRDYERVLELVKSEDNGVLRIRSNESNSIDTYDIKDYRIIKETEFYEAPQFTIASRVCEINDRVH